MHSYIEKLAVLLGHDYIVTRNLVIQLSAVLLIGLAGSTIIAIIHVKLTNEAFWTKANSVSLLKAWISTLAFAVFGFICFELFNRN